MIAGAFVEVGDHPEAHRQHHRPIDTCEPVGGGPVAALRRGEIAVEDRELRRRVGARGHDERLGGQRLVEPQHVASAVASLLDVASRRGDLGVERVREGERRRVALAAEHGEGRFEVGVDTLGDAELEVDQGPARQRQGPRRRRSPRPAQAKACVEPALGLDRGAGQPVRPAGAAGDRQRRLGVVVGDRPLEGGTQVVVLLGDGDQPRPLAGRRCRPPRIGRTAGRSTPPSRRGSVRPRRARRASPARTGPASAAGCSARRWRRQRR